MKRVVPFLVLATLGAAGTAPAMGQDPPPAEAIVRGWWQENGLPPVDYVLSKFDDHDWVFLGEYHRIRADVELVSRLIPALHGRTRVRYLALEMLCAGWTDDANERITARAYDRASTIDFFRGQFPDWALEEYLELFRTAWESNQVFAEQRGAFRFVGLHPCVDWEVVNYGDDERAVTAELRKRDRYDEIMASELETHLLQPGHPALIYTGIAHATAKYVEYWHGRDEQLVRMGNLVYREPWRERMFFIAFHAPLWDAGTEREIYPFDGALDRAMLVHRSAVGFDVVNSPLASLTHAQRSPRSFTAYEFGELYDGYIIHEVPLRETVGATCVPDWLTSPDHFRHFWRHLQNKEASLRFSQIPFNEFREGFCAPRPDHGLLFSRRFRSLPPLR